MSDILDKIEQLRQAVGPQRTKTKDVEVEQFPLKDLLLAATRLQSKPVTLNQFPMTIASPKYGYSCPCDQTIQE